MSPPPVAVLGNVLVVGVLADVPATEPALPPADFSVSLLVSDSSGTRLSLSKVSLSVVVLSRSRTALTLVTALPGPSTAASIPSSWPWRPRS